MQKWRKWTRKHTKRVGCAQEVTWSRLTLECLGAWGAHKGHDRTLNGTMSACLLKPSTWKSSLMSFTSFPLPPMWSKSTFWHSSSPTYQESVHLSACLSPILVQLTIISHLNLTSASNWALGFLPCLGSVSCLQSSQTTLLSWISQVRLCLKSTNVFSSDMEEKSKFLTFPAKPMGPGVAPPIVLPHCSSWRS